jgi:exodeoxyribonuclease VII large subunit
MTENVYTITEITNLIREIIKKNVNEKLKIIGEISNFKLSKANAFFTLKDEEATISVVVWNYSQRKYNFENGNKIKATGQLTIFNKSGTYNFNASKLELIGTGDLYKEYMSLKDFYTDIGYFDEQRKKKLPSNISKLGILTALDGAALQDFLYVLKKNHFVGTVYVQNCQVQGKDCPRSVVEGLKKLDTQNLDVIVISRGGGSFEDLFGFSDTKIIEAIYESKTCTISAIGHEIDFMLSDFVADIRAPTPSIAGEIVCSKKMMTCEDIDEIIDLIGIKINHFEISLKNKLLGIKYQIKSPNEIMDKLNMELKILENNLQNEIVNKINKLNYNLHIVNSTFQQIKNQQIENPVHILSKGYCLVFDHQNQQINTMNQFTGSTNKKKKLKLKFIDGEATFEIRSIKTSKNVSD